MSSPPLPDPRAAAAALGRAAAVVSGALDCIVIIDARGVVVEFNPAAVRTFGWSREEAVGRRLHELIIPEEFRAAHVQGMAHFLETGVGPVLNQRVELPAVRKDGSTLTVELVVVPSPSATDYEFTGFVRDITELRATQEQLRRSEERYEAIARNSNRALVLCNPGDSEGSVLVTGERVLGHPPGMPLPDGFLGLVHEDDRARAEEFMTGVADGSRGAVDTVDVRLRTAAGGYVLCEVFGEDLRHVDAIQAIMFRASDVTADRAQRRALEDAAARMRTLIDRLSVGVLLEDDQHRVLVLNQALFDLFGVDRSEQDLTGVDVIGAAQVVMHRFADPEAYVRGVDQLVATGETRLAEELTLADGRVLERDYVPIRSLDREAGHLWVYRDVTQRAEEQRRLEEQNRSLAELSALKNEFVATVSHELRTPLTAVVSFAELLNHPTVGTLNEEQGQFLEIIDRNAQKLLRLIDDLLLVAKLEARTLPMTIGRLDAALMVRELVAEALPRAGIAGIALEALAPQPVWLKGDAVRLQQVVSNLVGNALHYTLPGGEVTVTSAQVGQSWVLSVVDTGVGIPEAEQNGIFDAFERASTSTQSGHHGTGLGLAISRLIIEQHGGSIGVESEVGRGTTMTVRLPAEGS